MDKIKPCSTYRFEIKIKTVTKSGNRETEKDIGTVRDVILPPMAFVSNFKLPLLSKVCKNKQLFFLLCVCVIHYVEKVNKQCKKFCHLRYRF